MVGNVSTNRPLTLRRIALILVISFIAISSVIIVDVNLAGYEYEISEPSFSHGFPETIFFYNSSEGVTCNIFSFIVILPANHSGHHCIIPREISLLFWFKDASDGLDLSTFILEATEHSRNSTCSINFHRNYRVDKSEAGWWAPSLVRVAVNDRPDVDFVRFGIEFGLILVNTFGDDFAGHDLNVQLEMNVTYSRWWYGLSVSPSHQIVHCIFNLPDDGITTIQSLESGLP
jgi:hypothetical protein